MSIGVQFFLLLSIFGTLPGNGNPVPGIFLAYPAKSKPAEGREESRDYAGGRIGAVTEDNVPGGVHLPSYGLRGS